MPFNGSGTFTLAATISPGDEQSATALMAILTDIRDGLTASVAKNGESTLTGPIKAANGAAAAPSYGFGSDTNTGIYSVSSDVGGAAAGGAQIFSWSSTGITMASGKVLTGGWAYMPSGTKALFQQTAAPTGWTKDTTHNDKALRVVSGTASTGGSVAFTTAFSASRALAGTSGSTVLTEANLPSHFHYTMANVAGDAGTAVAEDNQAARSWTSGAGEPGYSIRGDAAEAGVGRTSSVGSGTGHTHTLSSGTVNLAVNYVDVIIATKD